eukprot:657767-Rhodomonas_salina.1
MTCVRSKGGGTAASRSAAPAYLQADHHDRSESVLLSTGFEGLGRVWLRAEGHQDVDVHVVALRGLSCIWVEGHRDDDVHVVAFLAVEHLVYGLWIMTISLAAEQFPDRDRERERQKETEKRQRYTLLIPNDLHHFDPLLLTCETSFLTSLAPKPQAPSPKP